MPVLERLAALPYLAASIYLFRTIQKARRLARAAGADGMPFKRSHRENVWVHHAALPGSATSRSEHLSITSAMRLSTLRKP